MVMETSGSHPDRCLSLTVSGPWAHFRRIEGNIVKQTYRIMPRTTVAGLLAALLGIGRDEYYDLFGPRNSAIAIEPVRKLRTMNLPMNTLSTAESDLQKLNSRGAVSIKLPDPTKNRQQHNYEVLVDPAYRIDVALEDESTYRELKKHLADGRSHYVPSLGLSEHLATIHYHGEYPVRPGPDEERVRVDSAVPTSLDSVVLNPSQRVQVEESPGFMTMEGGGRITDRFITYSFSPEAEPIAVRDVETAEVDGRTVAFV
ncbi:MAG: type I-B CRISPR-associated protein Cas5b [Candidatus Nanohaloarchaea archaeon]